MIKNKTFIKFTQWEHWPTLMFYIPLIPYFGFKILSKGKLLYYLNTNPGILYSGNGTESKYETLLKIPEAFRPKSILFKKGDSFKLLLQQLEEKGIEFPLIAKPDIGFRGYLVKKIDSKQKLRSYTENFDENIIIQEFVPYQKELGIFYHRLPNKRSGKITSVTIKKFLVLKGNGKDTLKELMQNDKRAFLYYDLFRIIHKKNLKKIIPKNEKITLSVIGNHSKGTEFINGEHLINRELEEFTDKIALQIDGWYYGRIDLKYKNMEDLLKVKNFKILEVNGIISEPTHIYDASHKKASYRNAVISIKKHWEILDKIARKNMKMPDIKTPKMIPYLKNMLWLRAYSKKLKRLNKADF
ncbi:MAG: hypothetical protein DSY82_01345 [Flavobacteriia bacterium]|nr:MAG: hypothetical protein DSY82_01345 [Flavobacteriia bacterium]